MELGIFSRTFSGSAEDVFKKMYKHGFSYTHYNLSSAGLETMPMEMNKEELNKIKNYSNKYSVVLHGISGTFNMIAPDKDEKQDGIKRFNTLCEIADFLDIRLISLCTGSKNPKSKWAWHEDNDLESSMDELFETTVLILKKAKQYGVALGVEPEKSNVINSAAKAKAYVDEFAPHLKIIMDGANLLGREDIPNMKQVMLDAFETLHEYIVQAHAKDIATKENISFVAAGEGQLDYNTYISLFKKYNYTGPLVLHGLSEAQVPKSIAFLKELI
ncbi:MAG: sugar phosphate isomerase/epimerase [Eubacteriales bacterium]|nr:sugar phosphate isomerase/epimerase [Eubacteriales bacterium]